MTLERRKPLKRAGFRSKSATWRKKAPVNPARQQRKPVKAVSVRRQSEKSEYDALRRRLLKLDDPHALVPCAAGPKLAAWGIVGCTVAASELHHLRKRSSSGALCNPANVIVTCHHCNVVSIESFPIEARLAGLVVREGDPLWDSLSARAWRQR